MLCSSRLLSAENPALAGGVKKGLKLVMEKGELSLRMLPFCIFDAIPV